MGLPRRGQLHPRALSFGLIHVDGKRRDDAARHLVLDGEHTHEFAVVALCPLVHTRTSVDELRSDADGIGIATHAALQHVANTELTSHLADVWRLALVLEARVAGDDKEFGKARQLRDDVRGDAIAEVVFLWITANVGKR